MKRNWVNPELITVIEPKDAEDFLARKADIEAIEGDTLPPDYWDWAPNYFFGYWIFYLKPEESQEAIPVGLIRRDFFTRSVTMHGSCRKEYQGKGVEYYATLACLNNTFLHHKFTKVNIPVPDGDVATRAFARRWGFTKTDYREGDVTYWRLKRDQYLERLKHGSQKPATSQSS